MPCCNQPRGGLAVESTAGITTGVTIVLSLAMQSQPCILPSCNANYAWAAFNISLVAPHKTALPGCITIKPGQSVQASMPAQGRLKCRATARQHEPVRPQKKVLRSTRRQSRRAQEEEKKEAEEKKKKRLTRQGRSSTSCTGHCRQQSWRSWRGRSCGLVPH